MKRFRLPTKTSDAVSTDEAGTSVTVSEDVPMEGCFLSAEAEERINRGFLKQGIDILESKTNKPLAKQLEDKKLGLQIATIGLAEMGVRRSFNLGKLLESIDERMAAPEMIQSFKGSALMSLYKTASSEVASHTKYIQDVTSKFDWDRCAATMTEQELKPVIDTEDQHDNQALANNALGRLFSMYPNLSDAEIIEDVSFKDENSEDEA